MRISHVIKTDQWRSDTQIRSAPHFVVSHLWALYLQHSFFCCTALPYRYFKCYEREHASLKNVQQ